MEGLRQWGEENGLNSIYNKEKWEFVAKKQSVHVWGQGIENDWEEISGVSGGVWLNQKVEDEELDRKSEVIR